MKKSWVVALLVFMALITCSCENTSVNQNAEVANKETVTNENVGSNEKPTLGEYITNVVDKYNAQSTEQLVYTEDFTPSNRDSSHYRTEFRLAAYENAVGKSYLLGDKIIDLVASETYFGDINFRVYTNDTSLNQVIALVQGMSPIMDEELSNEELQQTIDEVSTKKTANGYYYGKLGITLFGSDVKGYELMIKND